MTPKEAIKEFESELKWAELNTYPYVSKKKIEALNMAIKALEQEPRWIPVSDHVPDYGFDVLVSVDMGSECAVGMDMYSAVEKEGFEGYGKAVLAWMPMPEPYKVESEDKE